MDGSQWLIEVPPDLRHVGPTRLAVRDRLTECGVAEVAEAELMVSELIGNAIVHAGTEITVSVRCASDRALVEVHDGSPIIPQPKRPEVLRAGGLGLPIVQALALRWGVEPCAGDGKTVWFEVPTTPTVA